MTEIRAIIQPFKLSAVVEALEQIPELPSLTVADVRGFGRRQVRTELDSLEGDAVLFAARVQIDIVVSDRLVDQVVRTIREHARTGHQGDGKIFCRRIDDAMRIRTGERGETAL